MSPLTNKQTITPNKLDETSVKPIEKEQLKSAYSAKGVHFFGGQCIIRVANTLELRQRAYEYIYQIYSHSGYIGKENSNLKLSIFDALPETTTLITEDYRGNMCGALTVVLDSPIGLPSDLQYKKEIDNLRGPGREISEIISLGVKSSTKHSVKILASLFYGAYLLAWRIRETTDFIINIVPQQSDFYCNKLLFKKIGGIKQCPRANGTDAVLLYLPLSLPNNLRNQRRIFPLNLFNYTEQEEISIATRLEQMLLPISDEEFYSFFIEKTEVWEKATAEQKKYIKQIYPPDKVNHFEVLRALAKGFAKRNKDSDDTRIKSLKISRA